MNRSTIFLSETQPIVVAGLEKLLADTGEFELVGNAVEFHEVVSRVGQLQPDLILLAQSTGSRNLLGQISQVKAASPNSRIVLWVSELGEVDSFRALQSGARAVVRKTHGLTDLIECLRSVIKGNLWIEDSEARTATRRNGLPRITPREREIVEHICRGLKNKEIAQALNITSGTVKVHLMHIFEKTGVKDRFQLALHARELLGFDPPRVERRGAMAEAPPRTQAIGEVS